MKTPGLGHGASWDTIVSLGTSRGRDKISKGFSKKVPAILVWDFEEETLSCTDFM